MKSSVDFSLNILSAFPKSYPLPPKSVKDLKVNELDKKTLDVFKDAAENQSPFSSRSSRSIQLPSSTQSFLKPTLDKKRGKETIGTSRRGSLSRYMTQSRLTRSRSITQFPPKPTPDKKREKRAIEILEKNSLARYTAPSRMLAPLKWYVSIQEFFRERFFLTPKFRVLCVQQQGFALNSQDLLFYMHLCKEAVMTRLEQIAGLLLNQRFY